MKKLVLPLIVMLLLAGGASAQSNPGDGPRQGRQEPPKVEEMVSNLSKRQQRKLEDISTESKAAMDKKRTELESVRKSIRLLMDKEGDQSAKLFPLIEREATIKADISKLMYRTRLQIDEVLTKEQIAEFRAKCEADRKKHEGEGKEGTKAKTVHRKKSSLNSVK